MQRNRFIEQQGQDFVARCRERRRRTTRRARCANNRHCGSLVAYQTGAAMKLRVAQDFARLSVICWLRNVSFVGFNCRPGRPVIAITVGDPRLKVGADGKAALA